MQADLLVTDRPITPSGTGRAVPRLSWPGVPTDGVQLQSSNHVIRSQVEDLGASEITKDQPFGGGPSRKLNNIIGGRWQGSVDATGGSRLALRTPQADGNIAERHHSWHRNQPLPLVTAQRIHFLALLEMARCRWLVCAHG